MVDPAQPPPPASVPRMYENSPLLSAHILVTGIQELLIIYNPLIDLELVPAY